ncbi:phosphate signaling complex PhoU family protein [Desulfonatronovibrio hydrogenovorans]|uniref:phosphate signaling complex PhoU family protein n=1 Tax=Desulfonatronovibrio hydrogenovorans TaxID=53245 RepID=UPI000491CD03|nr:phosphate uptake regulator PhoU [Desulfonatronovibrio hydrogenovorans]
MQYFKELEEKIHFMVLEVTRQLENTLKIIHDPESELVEKVKSRDDHIDNYKSVIENICFSRIHGHENLHKQRVDFIRAANIISNNLERISDYAVNIVGQLSYLEDIHAVRDYRFSPYFDHMLASLESLVPALFKRDLNLALRICKAEFLIDKLYKKSFDIIIEELNYDKNKHDLVTCLFIFRYLERMGDSLLNIGEAIIFSVFGEKLKIHQYQALKESLDSINTDIPIDEVDFESIWESRSGCRIGKIMDPVKRGGRGVLFKEGKLKKIAREKENLEIWREIFPSLVPMVFSYNQSKNNASMLLEFLQGCSFQETLAIQDQEIQDNSFFLLKETLSLIWEKTMKPGQVNAKFIAQLVDRVDDVLMIHHEFDFSEARVGSLLTPSLNSVIELLTEIENSIHAPFAVFIHGDFNSNNIICNQKEQQIYFIDVHRSCYNDYVQDISVFLVSNFRQPNFDSQFRNNINKLNENMFKFALEFAQENDDHLFKARLALGLIRSFFTSTRFELNREFAGSMYQRAVYLAEKLIAHHGSPWEEFDFPPDVFRYTSF